MSTATAAPLLARPERVAAIDLGSNSARVVVVEVEAGGHLEVVEELRTPLRLALALGPDGRLPDDAVAATLAALHEFMAIARGAGAQRIRAVATAALRDARNADAILAPARRRLGLTIDVIDAQAEAEQSFVGAIYGLPVDHGLLVDIGGGSMEVVHFRDRAVEATWSFPFGVLRMWDQYLADDPPSAADLRRLAAHVRNALRRAGVPALADGDVLVGTGGSVRNLAKMDRHGRPYPIHRLHGYAIGARRLHALLASFAGRTLDERRLLPGLNPDRADAIGAGAAVLQGVATAAGAGEVLVAGQGIREGIIRRVALPSLPPPPDVRRASLRSIARRFARWDEERALHRAATAAMLQSELDPDMTPELRELLGHAAYVLDIGTAIDYYNRHRQTAAILAVTDLNGFSHRHTALIAALIRIAEKPSPGVRPYRPLLTKADAPALERAALILAIADELGRRVVPDRHPHVSCVVEPGCVRLTTQGDAPRQLSRLSGRFREAFGRALIVDGTPA